MTCLQFIAGLQVLLLIYAAMTDIAARLIPNTISLLLAVLTVVRVAIGDHSQLLPWLAVSTLSLALLLFCYVRGYLGGGDVKLLGALIIGLPATELMQLLTVMALAGGGLALVHLLLRHLPCPARPPAGASYLRRVYAVERWRNLRRAPLPYGVAIACGGVWTLVTGVYHVV
jgi:Flp pilus assembly protein protease CpaA